MVQPLKGNKSYTQRANNDKTEVLILLAQQLITNSFIEVGVHYFQAGRVCECRRYSGLFKYALGDKVQHIPGSRNCF